MIADYVQPISNIPVGKKATIPQLEMLLDHASRHSSGNYITKHHHFN